MADELTKQEREGIAKVLAYKQPVCPGCGHTMTLAVHSFPHREGETKREFSVRYYCKPARNPKNGCGVWCTNVLVGPLPAAMAEQAWKDAMARDLT